MSRPYLGPIQLSIQALKQHEHAADHFSNSSARSWSCSWLPHVYLTWWLTEHGNSFSFNFIFYISHSFRLELRIHVSLHLCFTCFVTGCLCLESGEFKSETVVIMTKITVKISYSGYVQKRAAIKCCVWMQFCWLFTVYFCATVFLHL